MKQHAAHIMLRCNMLYPTTYNMQLQQRASTIVLACKELQIPPQALIFLYTADHQFSLKACRNLSEVVASYYQQLVIVRPVKASVV